MKTLKTHKAYVLLILILGVFFITGCGSSSDSSSDTAAPTVSSTVPADVAIDVAINTTIAVTFSEAMAPLTVTTTTFTLMQGATPVSGTVAYSGVTAVFTPASDLAASTIYTATITTGAKDLAGNSLASNYVWSFTTGAAADTTAPTVSYTVPADAAIDVAIDTTIAATFSEAIAPLTVTTTTFTLMQGATPVSGTVAYSGVTAVFTPASDLAASTIYTATITTGAKDLAGNSLASNYVWSFTTGAAADTTAPTVSYTIPADAAIDVALNQQIIATFSEEMDPLTLTTATFTLEQGTTPVSGTADNSSVTAVFTPSSNLAPSTVYTATITTGAKDLAGNPLATDYVWSFTTGTTVASGPAPVLLGMAGNYVILAKTGVSTVPDSVITGDVGVSPAATTYLTGFSLTMVGTTSATSTQVTGSLYGADMNPPTNTNLTTATTNMGTAYTDAAGRPTPDFLDLGAGEIGGLTLVPGLYKWTTGVTISTDVTISGGANDVWIFQIPGNLSISTAKSIVLSGGAKAKNIFWQVAGYVEAGATSHFEGIILSQTAITLGTGASLNGRALAQSEVVLDQSTVTTPAQ